MPALWLTALAWASLATAVLSAVAIAADIAVRGYRQTMAIMDVVWPVTALYFGPAAVAFYHRFGRTMSGRWAREHGSGGTHPKPGWAGTAMDVSHCGAGCTLGDIIAEFVLFGVGVTIAGSSFYAMLVGDYVVALALGIAFQFFAIAPMRGLGVRDGLVAATKADVLSLTAFEVGLFGWMAVMHFVLFPAPHHLEPDSAVFWFLMQIGMIVGFATAWPANVWLLRRGIKQPM